MICICEHISDQLALLGLNSALLTCHFALRLSRVTSPCDISPGGQSDINHSACEQK